MMISSYFFFSIANTSFLPVIIGLILFYFLQQLIFLSSLMTITDSVKYGQWKNGSRNEPATLSIRPSLDKIAGVLSNGIVVFVAIAAVITSNVTATDIITHDIVTFNPYAFYVLVTLMLFLAIIFT